jgi:ketosteroid isomerase-like protein
MSQETVDLQSYESFNRRDNAVPAAGGPENRVETPYSGGRSGYSVESPRPGAGRPGPRQGQTYEGQTYAQPDVKRDRLGVRRRACPLAGGRSATLPQKAGPEILGGRCRRRTWRSLVAPTPPSTTPISSSSRSTCIPDITFTDQANAADAAATIEGKAAVLKLCSEWEQAFDGFRAEISEYVDAGDEVVCVTLWVGTGKQSAVVVDVSQVDAYAFRDGKVVDVRAALEAVGLSE